MSGSCPSALMDGITRAIARMRPTKTYTNYSFKIIQPTTFIVGLA